MTDNYSIVPPKELREEWRQEWVKLPPSSSISYCQWLITKASCWGWLQRDASVPSELQVARDEELDACCEWLITGPYGACIAIKPGSSNLIADLRAARRPKPKSQAEQALEALNEAVYMADDMPPEGITTDQAATIRAALERLRELEESND